MAFSRANSARAERTSATTVAHTASRADEGSPRATRAPQASMSASSLVGTEPFPKESNCQSLNLGDNNKTVRF